MINEEINKKRDKDREKLTQCPNCGKYSSYINSCPYCKARYRADDNDVRHYVNLKLIEQENLNYSDLDGFIKINNGDIFPLNDIKARYFFNNSNVIRAGLIDVDFIDFENKGLVGTFQAINPDGTLFFIKNTFQYNCISPIIFINGSLIKDDKILTINKDNTITYLVMKRDHDIFNIYVYENNSIKRIIKNVLYHAAKDGNGIHYVDINYSVFFYNVKNDSVSPSVYSLDKFTSLSFKIENIFFNKNSIFKFYFKKGISKNELALYYYLSKKYCLKEAEKELSDDNTINYEVCIRCDDYETISFITFVASKKYGVAFNIYDYPLHFILNNLLFEYKYDIIDYVDDKYKDIVKNILINYSFIEEKSFNRSEIINRLKSKYNCSDLELLKIMMEKYGVFEIFNLSHIVGNGNYYAFNFNYLSNLYDQYYKLAPESSIQWKSEYELFTLIKYYYNDAIFQYSDEKFLGLRIDIFVPSIKTAFEYQGIQHYEVVERFGDDLLEERIRRDNLKKRLCNENNIKLIEWKYTEKISKLNLEKKLTNL